MDGATENNRDVPLSLKMITGALKAHGIPHSVEGSAVIPFDEYDADHIVFMVDETTEQHLRDWLGY